MNEPAVKSVMSSLSEKLAALHVQRQLADISTSLRDDFLFAGVKLADCQDLIGFGFLFEAAKIFCGFHATEERTSLYNAMIAVVQGPPQEQEKDDAQTD